MIGIIRLQCLGIHDVYQKQASLEYMLEYMFDLYFLHALISVPGDNVTQQANNTMPYTFTD